MVLLLIVKYCTRLEISKFSLIWDKLGGQEGSTRQLSYGLMH